jgi:hypothetical protein
MARCLSEIQADIAEVREQIRRARIAVSRSSGGRSVSQNYTELRRELNDLLAEEAAVKRGGGIQFVSTRRRW